MFITAAHTNTVQVQYSKYSTKLYALYRTEPGMVFYGYSHTLWLYRTLKDELT